MTSPSPRTIGTTRLAELAGPTRGRPRYAPLTAGLLARKGEAQPASPLFAAEALGLVPQLTTGSRPQLPLPEPDGGEEPEPDIREALRPWRPRRTEPELNSHAGGETRARQIADEPAPPQRRLSVAGKEDRAALTLDLDLETLARLVLEARKRASSPSRVIEQALAQHLPSNGACLLCDSLHAAP